MRMGLVGLKIEVVADLKFIREVKEEKKQNLAGSHYGREDAVCSAYPFTFPPRLMDRLHFPALTAVKVAL